MAGKFLIRVGEWLNTRFPEKVAAEYVIGSLAELRQEVNRLDRRAAALEADILVLEGSAGGAVDKIAALEKKVETLTTDNAALKTMAAVRSRIAPSIPVPGR